MAACERLEGAAYPQWKTVMAYNEGDYRCHDCKRRLGKVLWKAGMTRCIGCARVAEPVAAEARETADQRRERYMRSAASKVLAMPGPKPRN